jgi:hypothetical protein
MKHRAIVTVYAGLTKVLFSNTCNSVKEPLEFVEKTKDTSNGTIKCIDPLDAENYIIIKFYSKTTFSIVRSSVASIVAGIIPLNTSYKTESSILTSKNLCSSSVSLSNNEWNTEKPMLTSCDGRYKLKMQNDGNLVVYKGISPVWSSQTYGKTVKKIVFQTDGNLVMYNYKDEPVWATNSWGKSGHKLVMQNDGNLVIYDCNWKAVWSTNSYERNK